jgi:hypothetical protein
MNFKSIMSLGLAAAVVGIVSVTPAQASNNNQYLNNLAMQMYMQNQAAAVNPYAVNGYAVNPYVNGAYPYNYGYTGGPTPWSAGAIPAASVYPSYYTPAVNYHHHWRH